MEKKIPQRQCMGCGIKKGHNELIRIVKTPAGEIFIESGKRMDGRGAYICRNENCAKKAFKRKGLERSFKMHIQKEIYDSIIEEAVKFEK